MASYVSEVWDGFVRRGANRERELEQNNPTRLKVLRLVELVAVTTALHFASACRVGRAGALLLTAASGAGWALANKQDNDDYRRFYRMCFTDLLMSGSALISFRGARSFWKMRGMEKEITRLGQTNSVDHRNLKRGMRWAMVKICVAGTAAWATASSVFASRS